MREYRLISADSHVVEPPDVWVARVPGKYRHRAPHMVSLDQGDGWIMEGSANPLPFGLIQCAGLGPENYLTWVRWDDVRKGLYDPLERLVLQDLDKTDAEILYPSPRISINLFTTNDDVEYHEAMVRAYNDWLSEFCAHAPERLLGLALIPTTGLASAIQEMKRVMKLPGIRGITLGRWPTGALGISPEDDEFWWEAENSNVPISIHVSLASAQETGGPSPFFGAFTGALRFADAPTRIQELIYTKVFDRFPRLMVVFAEVDCAWVPYVREQLDDRYDRQRRGTRPEFDLKPSEYFERNISWTIVADALGIKYRHDVGLEQIMWSSDFPHGTCDWPESDEQIARDFLGVPKEERDKILAGNAVKVYGLASP